MKRLLTALIGIPLVILLVLVSPTWFLAFVIGFFAALGVEEFLRLAATRGIGRPNRWFLVPAALVTISFIGGPAWVLTALTAATIALLTVTTFGHSLEAAFGHVAAGLAGVLYISVTLGFLVLLPPEFILFLFAIIWAGDAAAYYGGRAFGRHPLAPRVSPKKTVEGAIAGLLGSVLVGIVLGISFFGGSAPSLLLTSAVTGVAGQAGDLAESALKRSAGVKDSSSILPGHGGILDRLDSLFFAAPVFYWFFST
jgi:phosphatidate cytidylyltransferase